jgi:hypothetical protein
MEILALTFVLFLIIVLLMAVGVMITGKSLRGSCGGPSCTCVMEGKDIGSCEVDEGTLPIHPMRGN